MEESTDLANAARWELVCLWDDLDKARRNAINGEWSVRCDGLVERIELLTKHVGPTPWEQIQIPLLEDGTYQRIHAEMGVTVDVDMGKVAEMQASIDARMARLRP